MLTPQRCWQAPALASRDGDSPVRSPRQRLSHHLTNHVAIRKREIRLTPPSPHCSVLGGSLCPHSSIPTALRIWTEEDSSFFHTTSNKTTAALALVLFRCFRPLAQRKSRWLALPGRLQRASSLQSSKAPRSHEALPVPWQQTFLSL